LQGYDYGSTGCYFVTICTKNREHYFGEIVNKTNHVETDNYPSLRATEIGEIAKKFWLDIPNHFPFVILDQYVIMPNHIHGILIFNKNVVVETDNYPSLQCTSWQPNKFGRQSQNLGSVIRGFKSSLKRYANENKIDFAWQERFHDRIICDNDGLNNVRKYIFYNPQNWIDDELNDKNVNDEL